MATTEPSSPLQVYRDFSRVEADSQEGDSNATASGATQPNGFIKFGRHDAPLLNENFPAKWHHLLSEMERTGLSDIASWAPHGRCFVVHKPNVFVDQILRLRFRQKKFSSFQRQLNIYGFQRVHSGPDEGGYYHERFLRGRIALCRDIPRVSIKGSRTKHSRLHVPTTPDFYRMPPVVTTAASNQSTPLRQNEADTQAFSVQPLTSNVHRVLSRALISRIEDTQPIARGALSVGTPATSTLGSFSPLPESMGAESAALIVASARENPTAWRETIPTLHVTGSQANLAVFNTRRGLHFSTPSALEILRAMSGSRSHQRDGVSGTLLRSPIGLNRALDCIGASAYGHVAAVPPRNLPFEHMHALLAPWDHKGLVIFENQCRAMMRP